MKTILHKVCIYSILFVVMLMKKETLTTDIIKKEINKTSIRTIKIIIVYTILLIVYAWFFINSASVLIDNAVSKKNTIILICIISLIGIISYVFFLVKEIKLLSMRNIQVVTDKLVNVQGEEIAPFMFSPRTTRIFSKPYRLYFAKHGSYTLTNKENQYYEWSELYCMSANGVYNYSNVGDEFYLVLYGKKIILAYNTKLFELK